MPLTSANGDGVRSSARSLRSTSPEPIPMAAAAAHGTRELTGRGLRAQKPVGVSGTLRSTTETEGGG